MMESSDVRWLRRHATITPFGAAVTTWLLSVWIGGGQWLFWHDLDPAKAMAGLGTIAYGIIAVVAEGGIKVVFWALDERKKKMTYREIAALTEAREILHKEQDATGVAVLDKLIDDRRRDPLRQYIKW